MSDAPADVIEKALRKHMRLRTGDMMSGAEVQDAALIALDALAGAGLVVVPSELLEALTDQDECWFDHHGGCQAHGYLSLEPGERCPQAEAKEILAALPERTDHA